MGRISKALEDIYQELVDKKIRVTVFLRNGVPIRGIITEVYSDGIRVVSNEGENLIPGDAISTVTPIYQY